MTEHRATAHTGRVPGSFYPFVCVLRALENGQLTLLQIADRLAQTNALPGVPVLVALPALLRQLIEQGLATAAADGPADTYAITPAGLATISSLTTTGPDAPPDSVWSHATTISRICSEILSASIACLAASERRDEDAARIEAALRRVVKEIPSK